MHRQNKNSILVVGTVRNVEKIIYREIKKCQKSLKRFDHISFLLIESDSKDLTISKLEFLKKNMLNFSFITLGNVGSQIHDRLDRIRYCRNKYIEQIRILPSESRPEYVLVVDLDGMNSALNSKAIDSCFTKDDWDVVLANQTFGYYDILALRQTPWQVGDYTVEYNKQKKIINQARVLKKFKKSRNFFELDKLKQRLLYSKMLCIRKNDSWIQVDSGFGGAAIYKTSVLLKYDYVKDFETSETDHVTLHRKLVSDGGRIFINPRFINSHVNTYNINKLFLVRIVRNYIWAHNGIYSSRVYVWLKQIFRR